MRKTLILLPLVPLALSGCIVRTAANVVTLPVRAVGAGVDAVTTSQSEADERRGRELRREEERLGRIARRCERNPDREECAELSRYREPER
jgi:hypothetical protein